MLAAGRLAHTREEVTQKMDDKGRNRGSEAPVHAITLWILSLAVGLAIGAGIGAAIGRVGVGVPIGTTAGVAVGLVLVRRARPDSKDE